MGLTRIPDTRSVDARRCPEVLLEHVIEVRHVVVADGERDRRDAFVRLRQQLRRASHPADPHVLADGGVDLAAEKVREAGRTQPDAGSELGDAGRCAP